MTVVTPRVLVVSESRITRRVVEMTFADQSVELVVAASGQAGLDAWNAHAAAVVLADVSMEAPDGVALARHVQATAAGRRVGVLLMAGLNDTVDASAAADADVRGTLRKPLDSLQLIDAVREVLRSARVPRPAQAIVPGAVEAQAAIEPVAFAPAVHGTGPVVLAAGDLERLASVAASEAAERLVREMAPALVQQVARLVVADVSERLVREEIARMRSAHAPR